MGRVMRYCRLVLQGWWLDVLMLHCRWRFQLWRAGAWFRFWRARRRINKATTLDELHRELQRGLRELGGGLLPGIEALQLKLRQREVDGVLERLRK